MPRPNSGASIRIVLLRKGNGDSKLGHFVSRDVCAVSKKDFAAAVGGVSVLISQLAVMVEHVQVRISVGQERSQARKMSYQRSSMHKTSSV